MRLAGDVSGAVNWRSGCGSAREKSVVGVLARGATRAVEARSPVQGLVAGLRGLRTELCH